MHYDGTRRRGPPAAARTCARGAVTRRRREAS
jgi:hypothetical protein